MEQTGMDEQSTLNLMFVVLIPTQMDLRSFH